MTEDVLIVFIVFSFITLFSTGIYKLIRAKMDHTGIKEETFDRLAKAFIEHKKNTNRRIEHLEAIISEEEPAAGKQLDNSGSAIEIEEKNRRQPESEGSSKLRNMLHKE